MQLLQRLAKRGILTEADRAAFLAYCVAWATWTEANAKLQEAGLVRTMKSGRAIVSPYVKIARDALADLRTLAVEFGLTPAARVRVKAAPPAAPRSKWADAL